MGATDKCQFNGKAVFIPIKTIVATVVAPN